MEGPWYSPCLVRTTACWHILPKGINISEAALEFWQETGWEGFCICFDMN